MTGQGATLAERVAALADELQAAGDRESRRRSYAQGVAYRHAAGRLRALLRTHAPLDAPEPDTRAEVWAEAAELADSVIVSWQGVAGLHPEAQEPHPAAIAAAGARRTLVVLRSRVAEAFSDRIDALPAPAVAEGTDVRLTDDEREALRKSRMTAYEDGKGGWLFRAATDSEQNAEVERILATRLAQRAPRAEDVGR